MRRNVADFSWNTVESSSPPYKQFQKGRSPFGPYLLVSAGLCGRRPYARKRLGGVPAVLIMGSI